MFVLSLLESIFLGVMNMTDFVKLMIMSIVLFPLLCIVISFSMFGGFLRINYRMGITMLIASLCFNFGVLHVRKIKVLFVDMNLSNLSETSEYYK